MNRLSKIVALSALIFGGFASASASSLVSLSPNLSTNVAGLGPITLTTSAFTDTYFVGVYADPSNLLCANCLDFVYLDTDVTGTVQHFSASNFGSFATVVGDVANGVVPLDFTQTNGTITFDFTGFGANQSAGFLIIETNAVNWQPGTVTVSSGTSSVTGPGFQPIPEPATFTLLGTGLLGAVGVIRRKFAA